MDVLQVCVSCRYHADQKFLDGKRGGLILYEALASKLQDRPIPLALRPVECMSACRNFCTLAFTGSRKMTMVFGRLNAADIDATCDALLNYAKDYSEKPDGFVLRADRPVLLQDKLLARVPPPEGFSSSTTGAL